MIRTAILLSAATVVVSSAAGTTAAGAAGGPSCGDTVPGTVTLTTDLTCTSGTALTLSGADTVVNLNGHTIDGRHSASTGISSDDPLRARGTVVNGTVRGFVDDGVHNVATVGGVALLDNGRNGLYSTTTAHVANSRVTDNGGQGIAVGQGGVIENTVVTRNPVAGISVGTVGPLTVSGTTVQGNGYGIYGGDAALLLTHDLIVGNARDGINCTVCFGSQLTGNTIALNAGSGIDLSEQSLKSTTISGNLVTGNTVGLRSVFYSASATITGNRFIGNRAAGAYLAGNTGTVSIASNQFVGNGYAAGSLVDGLGHPVNDGLHVVTAQAAVTIGANSARLNADYGIEAYGPTVTDGGGNTAAGNGNPAQCLGVTCSP